MGTAANKTIIQADDERLRDSGDQAGYDAPDSESDPASNTSPPANTDTDTDGDITPQTPMMQQYAEVKSRHPDCILFYRMGDFYEMFFDDAEKGAKALDIALTKRGKTGGNAIPMCGVPVHSHESYLARLIKAGYKVAICEQTETPEEAKKRGGYKALVNRDVVRIVTPGTIVEDTLLDVRSSNYLACAAQLRNDYALSWIDISTGRFEVQPVTAAALFSAIGRIAPSELVIPEKLYANPDFTPFFEDIYDSLTILPDSVFDSINAKARLEALYGVKTLDAFGIFGGAEMSAAGTLIDYAEKTQKGALPYIEPIRRFNPTDFMDIDTATRRNLELVRTMNGERKGSLLSVIDRTCTGAGARLLQDRLSAPSCDVAAIARRLDQVALMREEKALRSGLREHLSRLPDMERALSRLSLGRGGPRDLGAMRGGLNAAEKILKTLNDHLAPDLLRMVDAETSSLRSVGEAAAYIDRLNAALEDDLPFHARDGHFIKRGYSPQLDELRGLSTESKTTIARLEATYKDKTGVQTLRIKFNNVLGYFIEVAPKQADALMVGRGDKSDTPSDNPFIHRQTLGSAVRFTTPELAELETKILQAGDKATAIELALFEQLREDAVRLAAQITAKAQSLATLDVACALAELALDMGYTRPVIDTSTDFIIEKGRHPVVEQSLSHHSGKNAAAHDTAAHGFIANDCDLSARQSLWLLTGPNMAGKSTFLRQNALIAIMAQAGSFVPAAAARIGLIDKVFSRVGASDDLARGRSTFMVEMVETAAILNQSTPRSLVILDEIGRGTATFDGLSIAWGTLEYLHDACQCRGLFATHYHELTTLEGKLPRLSCHRMNVKEWKGDIIFMHQVVKGTADQSYGIHVARLAGLPKAVIDRADDILARLQQSEQSGQLAKLAQSLPLFQAVFDQAEKDQRTQSQNAKNNAPDAPTISPEAAALIEALRPDDLSPKQALEWLYTLKEKLS